MSTAHPRPLVVRNGGTQMTEVNATEYPVDMASVMASMLSQQIDDGTLEVKHIVVMHDEEANLYALQITYKRARGSSC